MAGPKLQQTIAAAQFVVQRLAPTDLLSVVQFDERVKVVVSPRHPTNKAFLCGCSAGSPTGGPRTSGAAGFGGPSASGGKGTGPGDPERAAALHGATRPCHSRTFLVSYSGELALPLPMAGRSEDQTGNTPSNGSAAYWLADPGGSRGRRSG